MIYLDNAATSFPKPPEVIRAAAGVMQRLGANPGRSGHRLSLAAGRVLMQCRIELAALMQVPDPENILFCFNCTDALNTAIHGCLRPGDHVVTTMLEHNSTLRPINSAVQRGEVTWTLLPPDDQGRIQPSQVQAALQPNTRLVAVNHVSNVTGVAQPVEAIGAVVAQHEALFLVDAAQSLGILPVHPLKMQADMVAFPGHKGLLGPYGTGGLYLNPEVVLEPLRHGGTGSSSESMLQPDELPERYESGTMNLAGIAGLLAGTRYVLKHGQEIAEHEHILTQRLLSGLAQFPQLQLLSATPPDVGVVSFNLGEYSSGEVANMLDQRNIAVRGGLHCAPGAHEWLGTLARGAVRASVGYANTVRDVDALIYHIAALCGDIKP